MTPKPILAITLIALVLVPNSSFADKRVGEPFDLGLGQSEVITGTGFRIGFESLIGEGRCPRNVECFWEGNATVRIYAETVREDRRFFDLNTHPQFQTQAKHLGFVIVLLAVNPYPVDGISIDPSDYVLTLVVLGEEDAAVPVRERTWGAIKELYR